MLIAAHDFIFPHIRLHKCIAYCQILFHRLFIHKMGQKILMCKLVFLCLINSKHIQQRTVNHKNPVRLDFDGNHTATLHLKQFSINLILICQCMFEGCLIFELLLFLIINQLHTINYIIQITIFQSVNDDKIRTAPLVCGAVKLMADIVTVLHPLI